MNEKPQIIQSVYVHLEYRIFSPIVLNPNCLHDLRSFPPFGELTNYGNLFRDVKLNFSLPIDVWTLRYKKNLDENISI